MELINFQRFGREEKFNSFEELLFFGREQLQLFETEVKDLPLRRRGQKVPTTTTGLERSIVVEPYFSQMSKMNDFIFTTASTNNPSATPFFQPFFIEGITRLSTAKLLYEKLTPNHHWVLAQNPIDGDFPIVHWEELDSWEMAPTKLPWFPFTRRKKPKMLPPFYLLTDMIDDSEKGRFIGSETLKYVNSNLFEEDDPLVGIFMEDSCPCGKTLYDDINFAFKGR